MDVALYVGLTVACVVIGGLAIFLARLLRRKGRDHSLYSMARNGKHFRGNHECSIKSKTKIIHFGHATSNYVKRKTLFFSEN